MYQPDFNTRGQWYRSGANVAGMVVAGQCIVFLLFLGFGLTFIGIISTAVSSNFTFTNTPLVIGIVFLCIGSLLFTTGIILLICAVKASKNIQRTHLTATVAQIQPHVGHGSTQVVQSQSYVTGINPPPVQSGLATYGQAGYLGYQNDPYTNQSPYPVSSQLAPPKDYPTSGAPAYHGPTAPPLGYPAGVDQQSYALPPAPPPYFEVHK